MSAAVGRDALRALCKTYRAMLIAAGCKPEMLDSIERATLDAAQGNRYGEHAEEEWAVEADPAGEEGCPNYPATCRGCVICRANGESHDGPCFCDCPEPAPAADPDAAVTP